MKNLFLQLAERKIEEECFDFCTILGDTLKEKAEAIFLEIAKISQNIGGAALIIMSPEISCFFECGSCPINYGEFMGISYMGRFWPLSADWYKNSAVPHNVAFIINKDRAVMMKIENLVI